MELVAELQQDIESLNDWWDEFHSRELLPKLVKPFRVILNARTYQ